MGQPEKNPEVHRPLIAPHEEPRITCVVDKEHTKTTVTMTFKYEANQVSTPGGYFAKEVEEAFRLALDNRLYKLMRKVDPPFFSACCSMEEATRTTSVFSAQIVCEEGKVSLGLEAGLRELTRDDCVHGFTEQEIRIAKAKMLADAEQLFVERDQTYCTSQRDELVGHFLRGEMVVGSEEEARLSKACIDKMSTKDLREYAQKLCVDRSCVIRAMEGRATTTEADIAAAMTKIQGEEEKGEITETSMFHVPETLIEQDALPAPGKIVSCREFSAVGFKVLELDNGMRVALKTTDFLDDQVLVRAFARGGLSEVGEPEYLDALYANTIASELGMYGTKPEVLYDVLAETVRDVRQDGHLQPPRGRRHEPRGHRDRHAADPSALHLGRDGDAGAGGARGGASLAGAGDSQPETRSRERLQRDHPASRVRSVVSVATTSGERRASHENPRRRARISTLTTPTRWSSPSRLSAHLSAPRARDGGEVPRLDPSARGAQTSHGQVTPAPFKFPRGVVYKDLRVPMVEPMAMASITFPVEIPNPDWDEATNRVTVSYEGSAALTREKPRASSRPASSSVDCWRCFASSLERFTRARRAPVCIPGPARAGEDVPG